MAISTYPMINMLFREEKIIENELSLSAEIYSSEKDTYKFEEIAIIDENLKILKIFIKKYGNIM